jgi:molybdate transport system substrate-binding protein
MGTSTRNGLPTKLISLPKLMTSRRKFGLYFTSALISGVFVLTEDKAFAKDILRVSVAISLREAFLEAMTIFEQENPTVEIQFNFAASGVLRQQIERGANLDIFASADLTNMDFLAQKELILKNSRVNIAKNQMVVVVPKGNPNRIAKLKDLVNLNRIAIANPNTVPAGQYAKQALTRAGIFADLEKRKLIYAENVRQVLAYVEQESVNAGLIYSTDALISNKVEVALRLPLASIDPIIYPMAILSESKNSLIAQKFINLIRSDRGQKILRNKGFLPV